MNNLHKDSHCSSVQVYKESSWTNTEYDTMDQNKKINIIIESVNLFATEENIYIWQTKKTHLRYNFFYTFFYILGMVLCIF